MIERPMSTTEAIKVLSTEANHIEGAIDNPRDRADYLSDFFKSSYAEEFVTAINMALVILKGEIKNEQIYFAELISA